MTLAARIGAFAALTMVALPRPLPAQLGQPPLGRWVRIVDAADSAHHQGRLVLVVADTAILDDGHRLADHIQYVPMGAHGRIETPRHIRTHPVEGAVLGVGVGMAVGALSYVLRGMFTCFQIVCPAPAGQLISRTGRVIVGGIVGVALGTLVGSHVYTTAWDPVPPDQVERIRVGVSARPGTRLGLGASFGF